MHTVLLWLYRFSEIIQSFNLFPHILQGYFTGTLGNLEIAQCASELTLKDMGKSTGF